MPIQVEPQVRAAVVAVNNTFFRRLSGRTRRTRGWFAVEAKNTDEQSVTTEGLVGRDRAHPETLDSAAKKSPNNRFENPNVRGWLVEGKEQRPPHPCDGTCMRPIENNQEVTSRQIYRRVQQRAYRPD